MTPRASSLKVRQDLTKGIFEFVASTCVPASVVVAEVAIESDEDDLVYEEVPADIDDGQMDRCCSLDPPSSLIRLALVLFSHLMCFFTRAWRLADEDDEDDLSRALQALKAPHPDQPDQSRRESVQLPAINSARSTSAKEKKPHDRVSSPLSHRPSSSSSSSSSSPKISMDDFIRNFLLKFQMHKTLDTFQSEWYDLKQSGRLSDDDPIVPDIYQNYQRLHDQAGAEQLGALPARARLPPPQPQEGRAGEKHAHQRHPEAEKAH